MAWIERGYRFLSAGVVLRSDDRRVIDRFDQDYAGFIASEAGDAPNLSLCVDLKRPIKRIVIRTARETKSVALPMADLGFVYALILGEILRNLGDFVFFHAGVVARDGRALILSGPPNSGKSTLVKELVAEGFTFYSDEFCPVHLESGRIYPFPRSVWLADRTNGRTDPREKAPISPESLGHPVGGDAVSIKALVFLEPHQWRDGRTSFHTLIRSAWKDRFLRELRSDDIRAKKIPESDFHAISLADADGPAAKGRLSRAVHRNRAGILQAYQIHGREADFSRKPALSEIRADEAARRWLSHMLDRSHPLAVETPGRLFYDLCRLLDGTRCYRLRPGDLAATKALLGQVWARRSGPDARAVRPGEDDVRQAS